MSIKRRRAARRAALRGAPRLRYIGSMRSVRERFAAAVAPGAACDLDTVALLIAAEEYPQLDIGAYLRRLDDLAAAAPARLRATLPAGEQARLLTEFLARERGFHGNQDDYYDRRNSYLNDVLDRRTGIPITLAVVYMEVARRLGIAVSGVGFPGHFLAKIRGAKDVIIDPFLGRVVDERECAERLRGVLGAEARLQETHLRAAPARQIVVRMLTNLKQIHLRARDMSAALACSERILLADPDQLYELRDRGLLYLELECFAAAQADLERFLERAPHLAADDAIRARLLEARKRASQLH